MRARIEDGRGRRDPNARCDPANPGADPCAGCVRLQRALRHFRPRIPALRRLAGVERGHADVVAEDREQQPRRLAARTGERGILLQQQFGVAMGDFDEAAVFLGVLARIEQPDAAGVDVITISRRLRDLALAIAAGAGMAALAFDVMTRMPPELLAQHFLARAYTEGGGTNVVNVILVDFRALDTLGEIFVVGVVALTVFALLRRFRSAPSNWSKLKAIASSGQSSGTSGPTVRTLKVGQESDRFPIPTPVRWFSGSTVPTALHG